MFFIKYFVHIDIYSSPISPIKFFIGYNKNSSLTVIFK